MLKSLRASAACLPPRGTKLTTNNVRRRDFLSSSLSSPPQTISHSAILPYPRSKLYEMIADIPSYPNFLPFCISAHVLSWSQPDDSQRKWPARASLGIGWGNISESYVSRVYCVPESIVEAVAGEAHTKLSEEQLGIYQGVRGAGMDSADWGAGGDVFKSLRTRWEIQDVQGSSHKSKVDLQIEFEFKNPLYAALSGAAVPKVAGAVVEAFEKRAREVLGHGNG